VRNLARGRKRTPRDKADVLRKYKAPDEKAGAEYTVETVREEENASAFTVAEVYFTIKFFYENDKFLGLLAGKLYHRVEYYHCRRRRLIYFPRGLTTSPKNFFFKHLIPFTSPFPFLLSLPPPNARTVEFGG
jgi:hypothetical protein